MGAAWAVDGEHLVTCAHVVQNAGAGGPGGKVMVCFPPFDAPLEAVVLEEGWTPDEPMAGDLALLHLAEPPVGLEALPLRSLHSLDGLDFAAYGFPRGFDTSLDTNGTLRKAVGLERVRVEVSSELVVDAGFSGAAVWSDKLGAVIAMLTSRHRETDGRVAFAVPMRVIAAHSPIVTAALQTPLDLDRDRATHWDPRPRGTTSPDASSKVDPRAVAVFHGRDEQARRAMFGLLQDFGLQPLAWGELSARTGSTNPYTGDVVETAFELAQAVVVLFTPDDEARLHPDLCVEDEPAQERLLTGQPRTNVILEAGMALISHPDQTIIVEVGQVRPISNLAGRNVVRITGTDIAGALNDLASRLETAKCPVNRNSRDWLDLDRFRNLAALHRHAQQASTDLASPAQPSPEESDELVLEVGAAAQRAGIRLESPGDQTAASFLRDQREPFDSAALAAAIPAARLRPEDAKRLVVELDRAGIIAPAHKPVGGVRGWLLTRT